MYYQKTYKVKGEDVDDFMVMQQYAYHSYVSSTLKSFLFERGYSKQKLSALKIGLQQCNEKLIHQKHLMFIQDFFVNLEFMDTSYDTQMIRIKNRFFNVQNELCAIVITQLYWFNNATMEVINPPQNIIKHF